MVQTNAVCDALQRKLESVSKCEWNAGWVKTCHLASEWETKLRGAALWLSYLVDCLLTLFVLLGLLLHLLPLFNVVDEREEVAQVNDEGLRLDEREARRKGRRNCLETKWTKKQRIAQEISEVCQSDPDKWREQVLNMWRQAGRERGGSEKNGKSKRCQRKKAGQEDYVNKKKKRS